LKTVNPDIEKLPEILNNLPEGVPVVSSGSLAEK